MDKMQDKREDKREDRRPERRESKRPERRPDTRAAGKPDRKFDTRPDTRKKPDRFSENKDTYTKDEIREDSDNNLDKLEGRNSVLEALKSGRSINKIVVSKGEREGSIKQILSLARENKVIVQELERTNLDKMSSTHAHQGVIAFVAIKEYVEVEDILKIAEDKGEQPFIIILDEITDPYNLGSILRTADAVGAHGVIIPRRRAVGLTTAVSKASAGAIEYVPVARVTNISQTIEDLKKKNIWVVGTDSTGEKPYYEGDLKGPIALVIGSEGEGMGQLIAKSCDFIINIPMKGNITSLNAAVAGSVVMYEILKQRSL
jgi:23S rRNA (guanosine2251-2'-O)-methyltransferase